MKESSPSSDIANTPTEEETEILDEEQVETKRKKEELQHDREIVDLCVWKPPITARFINLLLIFLTIE